MDFSSRAKRMSLGSLVFDDKSASSGHTQPGKLGSDGRIKVQIHRNAQSVVTWFRNFQPPERCEAAPKPRKFSTVALSGYRPASVPRLNIVIHIVGSRGDVQPFIPIAQALSSPPYGHRVRICTHPVFKSFVEENGIEFFSIGGDPSELMAYMVRNPGLLPSRESVKAGDIGKRRKEMWEIMNGAWRSCIEAGDGLGRRFRAVDVPDVKDLFMADAIIANPPSMAHIHCAEKLGIPLHMVFTMPWSPTTKFPHPLASIRYDGDTDNGTANYFSFILMELLTWQGLGDLINKFRIQVLRLDPVSPLWGYQLVPRLRVPYSYLWSPTLIPKPQDWGSHIDITGFSFLPLADSYTPHSSLAEFLGENGPPPIYIGFGSIVVDDPQALTSMIFQAVRLAGVRAIISKGWGGIGAGETPKDVYLIDNVPHDWLFQRVSAVVHHGGAGTTAAGIAAGCPSIVVPFFGDQPFWGQMISKAGAGPAPIPFKSLTAETLAASIEFALKPEVRTAVKEMANRMAFENGASQTAADFQRHGLDKMQCDLCPDRLAVWRHKRTGAHLSAFATSCLADSGLIEPRDMKPLRHSDWYVDEGAEHPIVGVIAATSLFFTLLATAGSEYNTRLKSRPGKSQGSEEGKTPEKNANGAESTKHDNCNPTPQRVAKSNEDASLPISDSDQLTISQSNHASQVQDEDSGEDSDEPPMHPIHPTQTQMELFANKAAKKSLRSGEKVTSGFKHAPTFHERSKATWRAQEQGQHRKAFYLTRATGRLAADVAKASARAPIALFYNVANGFHNYPSYRSPLVDIRRRDPITGLGSGLRTAGKEFVLGFYDALAALVVQPSRGAKQGGAKGLGKGVLNAWVGFFYNIGAAVFGLPGYTLKGFEKEFSKHHLTKLRAEILLIRLRQGIEEFRQATQEEKDAVIERWKTVLPQKRER